MQHHLSHSHLCPVLDFVPLRTCDVGPREVCLQQSVDLGMRVCVLGAIDLHARENMAPRLPVNS